MASFNELIFDLHNIVRAGGQISDDDALDRRQIGFWIINQRAIWIRQEFQKNHSLDQKIIQDLGCVDIEQADTGECCTGSSNCSFMRTVRLIPTPIEFYNRTGITRVGPIDKGALPYSFISYEQSQWSGNGRWNSQQIVSFIGNDRIYLKIPVDNLFSSGQEQINVQGVFNDPRLVASFVTCNGVPCYTDDMDFPLQNWMIEFMKDMILKSNFRVALSTPADKVNDATGKVTIQ